VCGHSLQCEVLTDSGQTVQCFVPTDIGQTLEGSSLHTTQCLHTIQFGLLTESSLSLEISFGHCYTEQTHG